MSLKPGDRVLFKGGSSWQGMLTPGGSGTSSAPITYGSYGTGRARLSNASDNIVFLSGRHDLVFDNLDLTNGLSPTDTTHGSLIVFKSDSSGTAGCYGITIRNSRVHDTPGVAIASSNSADHDWTIGPNVEVDHTGRHGILLGSNSHTQRSYNMTINGDKIHDVGLISANDPSYPAGKHGVYDRASSLIENSKFYNFPNGQAITLRVGNSKVINNNIHDVGGAIAWYDYSAQGQDTGTITISGNTATNVGSYFFYYDQPWRSYPSDAIHGNSAVAYSLENNTVSFYDAGSALDLSGAISAHGKVRGTP